MTARLIGAEQVCGAVEATVTEYLPGVLTWLAEHGRARLDLPALLDQVPDADALDRAALPAVAFSSPGTVGAPMFDPDDSTWSATWQVDVTVYARGDSYRATQQAVREYAAALRATVLQHRTLGGFASATRWVDEGYARLPSRSVARTIGGGSVTLEVDVADVVALWPVLTGGDPAPAQVGAADLTVFPAHPYLDGQEA